MSIATAIENAQQKVEACYTQVASQGGTIPTTKNLANLPQAISTVSETYVPNYIAPKNNVGGVYKADNTATSFSLNGATDIENYVLAYAFYNCTNLTSVDLSSLTTISVSSAMNSCFQGCTGLTTVDLSSLTTISNTSAMSFCFRNCTNLTSVDLSSLTTISGNSGMISCFRDCTNLTSVDLSSLTTISNTSGMSYCFANCTGLTTVDLSSLTTISGNSGMTYCFQGCTGLTTVTIGGTTAIDFGTRTNQFTDMFKNCAQDIDVYAPAANQTQIESFSGYPNFSGTGTVTWHWRS